MTAKAKAKAKGKSESKARKRKPKPEAKEKTKKSAAKKAAARPTGGNEEEAEDGTEPSALRSASSAKAKPKVLLEVFCFGGLSLSFHSTRHLNQQLGVNFFTFEAAGMKRPARREADLPEEGGRC